MSKSLRQVISKLLESGEEVRITEIAEMDVFDEQELTEINAAAAKKQRVIIVRNTVNSLIRGRGSKVLNVGKNVYRAVSTQSDVTKFIKKKSEFLHRVYRERDLFSKEMIAKGFQIQSEFSPEMEELAGEIKKASDQTEQALRASVQST